MAYHNGTVNHLDAQYISIRTLYMWLNPKGLSDAVKQWLD